jgi:hypothetical protein
MTAGYAPVSVRDLLTETVLAKAVLIAGSQGLDRAIRDLSWYSGELPAKAIGHLVVCAEAAVSPSYRLDSLVRRAESAGVTALLITAEEQPPLLSTIRLADRLRIPVLSVVGADLVELLHRLTIRVRAPEVQRARLIEDVVRRLSTKTVAEDILAGLSVALFQPVWLLNSDGTVIHGEPLSLPPTLRLDLTVAQHSDPVLGGQLLIHPVTEPGTTHAAAWLAAHSASNDEHQRIATASALAVAEPYMRAWLTSQRTAAERDSIFHGRLLADLIAGQDVVSQDLGERAMSAGWRLQDWHVGIHLIRTARPADPQRDDPVTSTRKLRSAMAALKLDGPVVDRGDGWTAWISHATAPPSSDGRRVLRSVRLMLAQLPPHWEVVAGVGRVHHGSTGLVSTLLEARDAATLARTHEHRPAAEHIDELGVARLLAAWQDSEILRAFAETALAPLRGIDGGQLLRTLRVYLEAGGSVSTTSHVLGLHRNTVTARLHRLRERLGIDLDDPNQRLALQLACRSIETEH